MTKEEKEAKKEGEKEVPERFVEAVNEFYESADIIFKCFDDIHSDYLRGNDIIGDLRGFGREKSDVLALISDFFQSEERVREWLDKAKIEKEKRDKIFKFTQKYSDLQNDIRVARLEIWLGFINPITSFDVSHSFDSKINEPLIDLKLHSGGNILRTKTLAGITYLTASAIQSAVLKCIEEIKDKNITGSSSDFKETANDIKKDAEKILEMIKEIEKKGKKK